MLFYLILEELVVASNFVHEILKYLMSSAALLLRVHHI
jgi:hypothetical protein